MSQKPRRISELVQEVGSTTRSSRVSRIAQPTRRTSASERTPSAPISAKKLFPPASATTSKRSYSATPQRTPNRQTQNVQGTTEKEKINYKNWIANESVRITEHLRMIESTLGKDFYQRGGIKNMSTKQFIIIVNYFLKFIAGNRLSVGINYVESIAKILIEIEYPYTVTKSSLKTPTAPHAFHNVVQLFSWFLTFLPTNPLSKPIDQVEEFENIYIAKNENFQDKEYACNFVRKSREIFPVWNNGLDKVVEEAKRKLADDMIEGVCNLNGLKELKCTIKKLTYENNKLQCDLKEDSAQGKEIKRLDEEHKIKAQKIEKYEKTCKSYSKEIYDYEYQIKSKDQLIKTLEQEMEKIKFEKKNQKMNVEERDNLLRQNCALNHELKIKRDNIMQLQEEGNENQTIYARLVFRKTALITKLNTFIYKMFTELKLINSLKFDEIYLNKDCEIKDMEQVRKLLQQISKQLILEITRIENIISKLEKHVALLIVEGEKNLNPTLEKYNKQIQDLNEKIRKVDETIQLNNNESENCVKALVNHFNDMKISKNQMLSELNLKTNKLNKLKESNLKTWNDFENKMESILKYREQRLETLSEAVDDYEKTVEGLQKFKD